jgi:hypothetical protein
MKYCGVAYSRCQLFLVDELIPQLLALSFGRGAWAKRDQKQPNPSVDYHDV